MVNFIIVMLLIMPWVLFPGANMEDQFRLPQALAMTIMFLGVIVWSFFYGNKYIYRNKYLALLATWMCATFLISFFIPYSIWEKSGRAVNLAALEPILHILLGLWALQIILSNIDKDDLIRIAKALCLSAVLVASFSILQYIGFDPMTFLGAKYLCGNKISACLDNPNNVGNYLALCLPLFFMFNKFSYGIGAALVVVGLYVANSHFAIFIGLLSVLLYFLFNYKNKLFRFSLLMAALLAGIVFINQDFAKFSIGGSGRVEIWTTGIDILKRNVLFGQGIGIWKTLGVFDMSSHTYWFSAHNDWLERTVEMGIIWLGLFITLIFNSFKRVTIKSPVDISFVCMFVSFLVMMFGSFPLEVPTVATLGLVSFVAIEKL